MILRIALLFIFLIGAYSSGVQAQSVGSTRYSSNSMQIYDGSVYDTPDYGSLGGCSGAGQMIYSGGTMRFCNGSTWRNLDSGVNNGGCSNAGEIRRNTTWLEFCNGSNWRKINPTHIDGACINDGGSNNLCSDGTANDGAISDTSAQWRWRCDGQYGGSNSGTCYKNKPINGSCTNEGASNNLCSAGTANDGAVSDTGAQWRWRCDGQYGGSNSGTCYKNKPVNGSCNNSSRNACSAGTSNDGAVSDTTTHYRWRCDGQYGGSNSGTCSHPKPEKACSFTRYNNYTHSDEDPYGVGDVCPNPYTGFPNLARTTLTQTSSQGSYERWYTCGWSGTIPTASTCPSNKTYANCGSIKHGDEAYFYNSPTTPCSSAYARCWDGSSQNPSYPYTSCTASPVNGVCNNSSRNACNAGSSNDGAVPDTTTQYRWRCDGQNGGSNSGTCSINRPGVCGSAASGGATGSQPTSNQCSYGTYQDLSDTGSYWQWRCNGNPNSGTCQRARSSGGGNCTVSSLASSMGCSGDSPTAGYYSTGSFSVSSCISYCNSQASANGVSSGCCRLRPVPKSADKICSLIPSSTAGSGPSNYSAGNCT